MAGSKRERDVARAKYERQQARRAEQSAKRRRRNQVAAATVVSVLVVVGVVVLAQYLHSNSSSNAAASTSPSISTGTASSAPTNANGLVSCSYRATGTAARAVSVPPSSAPTKPATSLAVIYLNGKPVTVRLKDAAAPCTVNSFKHLANAGFYTNTKCHRLTKGTLAVLQCGDPTGTGSGGPGYMYNDENLVGATYPAGTVAMANAGPNTNGSQFFLVYANSQLPASYTPFGTVIAGEPVLTAIAKTGVAKGAADGPPAKPVIITRIVTKA